MREEVGDTKDKHSGIRIGRPHFGRATFFSFRSVRNEFIDARA